MTTGESAACRYAIKPVLQVELNWTDLVHITSTLILWFYFVYVLINMIQSEKNVGQPWMHIDEKALKENLVYLLRFESDFFVRTDL